MENKENPIDFYLNIDLDFYSKSKNEIKKVSKQTEELREAESRNINTYKKDAHDIYRFYDKKDQELEYYKNHYEVYLKALRDIVEWDNSKESFWGSPFERAENALKFRKDFMFVDYGTEIKESMPWEVKYKLYLRSEGWHKKRTLAFIKYGTKCTKCKSEKNIQVHHKTYKNVFNERIEDLDVLCGKCHKEEHASDPFWHCNKHPK